MAEERKRVESVVSAPAKTKKKSEVRKITDIFVAEDASNVKSYILMDVLVPTIKKAIVDIVSDGIHMIFFGETNRKKSSGTSANYVSYRSYSDNNEVRSSRNETRSRNSFDYDDIIYPNRSDAEKVLDALEGTLDRYGFARVGDVYDFANLTAPYTSYKYGWTNLRNAEIVRDREGWVIKLPRAVPID